MSKKYVTCQSAKSKKKEVLYRTLTTKLSSFLGAVSLKQPFTHRQRFISSLLPVFHFILPGKTKQRFWVQFRSFSAHFLPMVPHFSHFSAHMFTEFAYFCLLLPIFRLKWYPILVINSSMVPICCFSAYMFMDSAYFLPIFCSFSTYFPPNLLPIFCQSCLARSCCTSAICVS